MSTSTELTVYDRVVDPMVFIKEFGKSIYESGMFGCRNQSQGEMMAMTCLTEKKTPIELARVYYIIDNKLSMRADAMLAEFRKAGGRQKWLTTGDDGIAARAAFIFENETIEIGYTIEEAKRALLVKSDKPNSNWVKDPGSMLRARTVSRAVRMLAPEIVAGYYTPEELGDGNESEAVQVGANGSAKRATVEELLAKSAAVTTPTATATTVVDKDVIDVEAEPVATTPATPEFPACTAEQSNQIRNLFATRLVPHEKQEAILSKYGANAIRNLTGQQAAKLITALESLPSKLPPAVTVASDYDVLSEQQLADLKGEMKKLIDSGDKSLCGQLAAKLAGRKVSQLCWADAESLLQGFKVANLEAFFARDLLGKYDQPKEFPTADEKAAHAATVEATPFDAK